MWGMWYAINHPISTNWIPGYKGWNSILIDDLDKSENLFDCILKIISLIFSNQNLINLPIVFFFRISTERPAKHICLKSKSTSLSLGVERECRSLFTSIVRQYENAMTLKSGRYIYCDQLHISLTRTKDSLYRLFLNQLFKWLILGWGMALVGQNE